MKQVIWKYPLEIEDRQILALPLGHRILSVGLDPSGNLCLWAIVDPDEKARHHFEVWIIGTGNPADGLAPSRREGWHFLGTVTMEPWVWHIFSQASK